jgi:DNA-3-methyladenine glycosylase I
MPPGWKVTSPRNDAEYFERMSKTLFTAGLSWEMVEKKWPNFKKAFEAFAPDKVAKMTEKDVESLMGDEGTVRNERKIGATVHNAREFVKLKKEFGSFQGYVFSLGKDEKALQNDLQEKFKHVGGSTARMFLWVGGLQARPERRREEVDGKERLDRAF